MNLVVFNAMPIQQQILGMVSWFKLVINQKLFNDAISTAEIMQNQIG